MNRNRAEEYRERAKTCHEAAAKARDPLAEAMWTGAEKGWLQLAEESRSGSQRESDDRR
jgi:hypothetical protein